jgi:hypothetical protein
MYLRFVTHVTVRSSNTAYLVSTQYHSFLIAAKYADGNSIRAGGIVLRKYGLLTLTAFVVMALVACGGGGSSSSATTTTTAPSTAQGVFLGTSVAGSTTSTFEAIILPDDKFYAIYGPDAGLGNGSFFVQGFVTGQGKSASGTTYTVSSLTDYYLGTAHSGSLSGTFVPGASVKGTITEAGLTSNFTGTPMPVSSFNYNTPASLAALTGTWTGGTIDDSSTSAVTVSSNGTFTGGFIGCSFTGTSTPDPSKNFFSASVKFQGSGCLLNGQTVPAVAVVSTLSSGKSELIVAITAPTYGTVYIGTK